MAAPFVVGKTLWYKGKTYVADISQLNMDMASERNIAPTYTGGRPRVMKCCSKQSQCFTDSALQPGQ